MKRVALLSSLIALAILGLSMSSTAWSGGSKPMPATGAMYDMWELEPDGIFRIQGAAGEFIEVHGVNGEMVFAGHIPEDYFEFLCPNTGIGPEGEVLHVFTSTGAYLCIDRDDDWIWE